MDITKQEEKERGLAEEKDSMYREEVGEKLDSTLCLFLLLLLFLLTMMMLSVLLVFCILLRCCLGHELLKRHEVALFFGIALSL